MTKAEIRPIRLIFVIGAMAILSLISLMLDKIKPEQELLIIFNPMLTIYINLYLLLTLYIFISNPNCNTEYNFVELILK